MLVFNCIFVLQKNPKKTRISRRKGCFCSVWLSNARVRRSTMTPPFVDSKCQLNCFSLHKVVVVLLQIAYDTMKTGKCTGSVYDFICELWQARAHIGPKVCLSPASPFLYVFLMNKYIPVVQRDVQKKRRYKNTTVIYRTYFVRNMVL